MDLTKKFPIIILYQDPMVYLNKKLLTVLIFALLIVVSSKKTYAVTATVTTTSPITISPHEFTIDVSVSGASSGTNYLKIDLFKSGTTNYFGDTYNGADWYNGTDGLTYFPITIQSGIWSGQVKGRINDADLAQLDQLGQYKLRIRRYTGSGNYNASEANNSVVDINIIFPTPTTTPSTAPSATIVPTPALADDLPQEPTPTSQQSAINNIYISEVMVYPNTGEKEWVELYNNNNHQVTLNDWYLDDLEDAGSTPKKFSLTLVGKSYGVYYLPSNIFNNDRDSVRLLDFGRAVKDSFEYLQGEKNLSWGRASLDSDTFCLQEPSPNTANLNCRQPLATPAPTATKTPTPTKIPLITSYSMRSLNPPFSSPPKKFTIGMAQLPPNPYPSPQSPQDTEGEVLSMSDNPQTKKDKRKLLKSLQITSSSYSLLAILSLIVKIKQTLA